MKIIKVKKDENSKRIYFCGIEIYKQKTCNFKTKHYFLGVKYSESYEINPIIKELEDIKYNLPIQVQAPIVHAYLQKYRNCNQDKDVVIVACGPTVNYYNPISNAKHLSINKAVVFDKIEFDYAFLTDNFSTNDTNKLVDEYIGNNCEKFYCLIPERRFNQIKHLTNCAQIPMYNYLKSNANILLLEDIVSHKWARELSYEPLGDFEGTVFSALQFLLYTNPKRIYLVGCDETQGYFFDKEKKEVIINEYSLNIWKKFKKFADYEYPDVEIVSINPIGLKGIFKDCYTQNYLNENGKLKANMEGINILSYE